jgi:hypothetical protein
MLFHLTGVHGNTVSQNGRHNHQRREDSCRTNTKSVMFMEMCLKRLVSLFEPDNSLL